MINSITELKKTKTANNGTKTALNELKTAIRAKSQANTQGNNKQAQKENKEVLSITHYPQVNYMFQQTKWSVANCKHKFPDCFHHKKALQKQLAGICKTLHQTDRLLAELSEQMSEEQKQTAKHYKRLNRYLSKQMQDVIDYVNQVEQADEEQLNALRYSEDEFSANATSD
ncbi:hypothetical protein [Ursidibacter sp. B-7004-1]